MLQVGIAVEDFLQVGLRLAHLVFTIAQRVLQFGQRRLAGTKKGGDGGGGIDQLLVQVGNGGVFGAADDASIGLLAAQQDIHQGGLAGAVGANQRDPVAGGELEGNIGENRFVIKLFSDLAGLQ